MEVADLLEPLTKLHDRDLSQLTADELMAETLQLETARAVLEAAQLDHLAAIRHRRAECLRNTYRSDANMLAARFRQSRASVGRRLHAAEVVTTHLPKVAEAYRQGEISPEHLQQFVRIASRSELLPALVRDQGLLLSWAIEQWPTWKRFVDNWVELVDPTDPQDIDDKAHNARRLIMGQGLDHTVLAELTTPNLGWEQIIASLEPVYDRMVESDWAAAKERVGDDATHADLDRTDPQRWHDALLEVIRAGASAMKGGATDPGIAAEVVIIIDAETLEAEADRREGTERPPRPTTDAEYYRCETLSGRTVTPSVALDAALSGHIRRITFSAASLDFEQSKKARLFTGPKRLGLMIRDRHCQGAGCDTPAHRCEADHIREHAKGGETVASNGIMRCRPCHRHKTRLQTLGLWPAEPPPPPSGALRTRTTNYADAGQLVA